MQKNGTAKLFFERLVYSYHTSIREKFDLWRLQMQREDQYKSIKKGIVGKALVSRKRDLFLIWKK